MRTNSTLPIASLLLVFPLAAVVAEDTHVESRRGKVYDSPEKAYEGYVVAVNAKDTKQAYEALTAGCQDFLFFEHWIGELTGNVPDAGLGKFVDESKRREITREALPTRRRDLPPLLGNAIKDRGAAFETLTPMLWRLRHNTINRYRVANVKIEGDRATADLFFKDSDISPTGEPLLFERDSQGWLVDLRSKEYFGPPNRPKKLEVQLRDDSQPKHASAEAAFTAFEEGCRELDAAKAWHTMTPAFRNEFLFSGRQQLREELGDVVMLYWYGNLNAFVEADLKIDKSDVAKRAQVFARELNDPLVFLAAVLKRGRELEVERGRRTSMKVSDIDASGDRAVGKVVTQFEAIVEDQEGGSGNKYPALMKPVSFRESSDGWFVDASTAMEIRRRKALPAGNEAAVGRKRTATYDSPQKVFEACQHARQQFDAATVGDCLTEESWDSLIFNAWTEQFHFGSDAPTQHEVIDDEKRRELTREKLPVKHKELQPLLIAAIPDRQAALALSLHHLDLDGELRDVKIDGHKASAKLLLRKRRGIRITHSLSAHQKFSFSKDKQGWRIDLVNRPGEANVPQLEQELDETEKRIRALEPRQPKPWTGEANPKLDTPKAVVLSQREAILANDPETLWHCLTEGRRRSLMQEKLLMLVESGGGDYILSWYIDNMLLRERQGYHAHKSAAAATKLPEVKDDDDVISPAREARERWSFQQNRAWQYVTTGCIYDPPAYFSAIVKRLDLTNRKIQLRYPDQKPDPITDVRIEGDRAIVTLKNENFDYRVVLAKVDGKWLVDQPNEEEHIAEWRKEKEENRRAREEERKKEAEKNANREENE